MDAADVFHRDSECFERVVLPQKLFVNVWEEVQVFEGFEIARMHAVGIIELLVGRNIIISVM